MATSAMSKSPFTDERMGVQLPDEILLEIFSYYRLPCAAEIGRDRYENLLVSNRTFAGQTDLFPYVGSDLENGISTDEHDEYKLRLQTLSAISKASRNFRKVVLPYIYATYPGQTVVRPALFLRSIKNNPCFASMVKQIVIDPWHPPLNCDEVPRLLKCIGFQEGLAAFLEHGAIGSNAEAHVLLLLLRYPNVECLSFRLPSWKPFNSALFGFFNKIQHVDSATKSKKNVAGTGSVPNPLGRLKSFSLHSNNQSCAQRMRGAQLILQLSSVESVTVSGILGGTFLSQELQHIRSLSVRRSWSNTRQLLQSLKICTNLHSLHIVFLGSKRNRPLSPDVPGMSELAQTMRLKLPTLRDLRLDDREVDVREPHFYSPFRNGPALTHLAINEVALGCSSGDRTARVSLADALPESLQTVTIFRLNGLWEVSLRLPAYKSDSMPKGKIPSEFFRFYAIHEMIVDFLRNDQHKCPQLRTISLDVSLDFGIDVTPFGWTVQLVDVPDVLRRPKVVLGTQITPVERKLWETEQARPARRLANVLRRVE